MAPYTCAAAPLAAGAITHHFLPVEKNSLGGLTKI